MESGNPRPRVVVARRLGRPPVRPERDSLGRARRRVAHAARRDRSTRAAPLHALRDRSSHRQDGLGAGRARGHAARTVASRQRHVGVELGGHRRRARHRLLRIAGLYAYDMSGTLIWQKDLGDKTMRNEFGEGSTPALHGNRIVVVWDHFVKGASFIVRSTSGPARRSGAPSATRSTPGPRRSSSKQDGRAQVIVNGMNKLKSYDLETGAIVWEAPGTTMNPIPSPVHADGMVFVTSGFRGNNLKAIRLAGAKGDLVGLERHRLDARSRHAVRALAAPLRRHPLHPENELGDPVGVRRQERHAPLSGAAAGWIERGLLVAGRRRRVASTSPTGKARRWSSATARSSRCSRRTRWTTASTPRLRSSTARSTCAATSISMRSRGSNIRASQRAAGSVSFDFAAISDEPFRIARRFVMMDYRLAPARAGNGDGRSDARERPLHALQIAPVRNRLELA